MVNWQSTVNPPTTNHVSTYKGFMVNISMQIPTFCHTIPIVPKIYRTHFRVRWMSTSNTLYCSIQHIPMVAASSLIFFPEKKKRFRYCYDYQVAALCLPLLYSQVCLSPLTSFQRQKWHANKNVHNFWHCFLAQYSMPFHMVWSVLLGVLAPETTFWLVEIL